MPDAWTLTAADLTVAYATGEVTPEDARESVLGRIETVNPGLNAVVTIDLAGARAAAGARWRDGQGAWTARRHSADRKGQSVRGGLRATWGSALFVDFIAPRSAGRPVTRGRGRHVRALRERYGENFAAGHADTATLREVINRLDAASLNRLQGDLEKVQLDEAFRPGPSGGLIDTLQDAPTG